MQFEMHQYLLLPSYPATLKFLNCSFDLFVPHLRPGFHGDLSILIIIDLKIMPRFFISEAEVRIELTPVSPHRVER